jgi:hypothetical protein
MTSRYRRLWRGHNAFREQHVYQQLQWSRKDIIYPSHDYGGEYTSRVWSLGLGELPRVKTTSYTEKRTSSSRTMYDKVTVRPITSIYDFGLVETRVGA